MDGISNMEYFIILCSVGLAIGSPMVDIKHERYYDYYYDYPGTNTPEKNVTRIPTYISTSEDVTVNQGGTIRLPCQVDLLDPYAIIWKKNSNILALDKNIYNTRVKVEMIENGNILVIRQADPGIDEGRYTCQLPDPQNKIELEHRVKVRVPPEIQTLPANGSLIVLAGDQVTLKCKVIRGSPTPKIKWQRKQGALPEGQNMVMGNIHELAFSRATRHHSGVYMCSADNGSPAPAEAEIFLDVQHKPEIDMDKERKKDGVMEISCIVQASPSAEVSWYKNGELLPPNKIVVERQGNRHSLLIEQDVSMNLDGKYTCSAKNCLGDAKAFIEVTTTNTIARLRPSETKSISTTTTAATTTATTTTSTTTRNSLKRGILLCAR